MFQRRWITLAVSIAVSLSLAAPGAVARGKEKRKAAETPRVLLLPERLPADPVLVYDLHVGNLLDGIRSITSMFGSLDPSLEDGAFDRAMEEAEQELGFSLRDELLAQIGPEIAIVVDLAPIDRIAGAMSNPSAGIAMALGRSGILMRVEDEKRVRAAVKRWFESDGARVTEIGDILRIGVGATEEGEAPELEMFLGSDDGVVAFGFDDAWVGARLDVSGDRLRDGEDFRRVFQHLDAHPTSLVYFNVPKLRRLIEESAFAQGALQSDPEMAVLLGLLGNDDLTGLGFGSTTIELGDGARTSTFGPKVWNSGMFSAGVIGAIAVPNFMNATDRGKQKRTMADIRSIGTCVEEHAIDHNAYPASDGWVEVASLADTLAPIYIRELPTVDGWGAPLMFWSDGESYRIVSPGKDGEFEREWLELAGGGGGTSSAFASDIVFADGQFWQWPEGTQQ